MAFMILDGAIKTIHPSLEEASVHLRASRWQTFNGVFVPAAETGAVRTRF